MNQRRDWSYYAVMWFLTVHFIVSHQARVESPVVQPSPPAGDTNTFIPF